ncbi:D-glycero-alpha-D-manno-heptose 1-phosphate guanylyltransferase [bacterium BMS3Abin05]|nr:D-glycero-alpha-D-manno-heptose 1-phosphate guanylyltransferase [bacterium BMS3Abin05]GBE26506.1 D-glycero-alpha-D-manno-heptose 1-phosphate guanylyltransferase [bacterium BMS3Bbin03]
MKAVIMAGGFGTRLKPLTNNLPKPMVPVANKPMMQHIIELLKKHNISKIISLLFYQSEKIRGYFKDGSSQNVRIEYNLSEDDFGTAGSVKNAERFLDERFLVISGDVLTDFDLTKAIRFHEAKGSFATLILTRVTNPLPFGVVITDDSGKVVRFLEKPTWGQVFSDTVNTGIYILEHEVLNYIPEKTEFDFSKNLFPLLLSEGKPVYGYIAEGYWQDVGDLRQYQTTQLDVLEGKVNVDIPGTEKGNYWIGKNSKVGKKAVIEKGVIIGNNCDIQSGALISRSIIGDNCIVGGGAQVRDSVVWNHVIIGPHASLLADVIADHSVVGNEAILEENVFISDHTKIGKRALLKSNIKIWPRKEIEDGAVLTSSFIWGDRWLRELFTNSRVTGIINLEVSPEFGAKLGAVYSAYLGKGKHVLSSRDTSNAARMINRSLICGFMSSGVHVDDLRIAPIPIVRYQLHLGKEQGGVHVRQSPQDERKVDIIFFDFDGKDLPVNKTKSIERLFMQEDFPRASFREIGKLDFPVRIMESYTEDFLKHINTKAIEQTRFKIVIDYSYGASGLVLPSILGSMDCEVISVNAYLDAHRVYRRWEDFRYGMLQLSNIVNSLKGDIGFLINADAESLTVVDENGKYFSNEYLLLLVTQLYLQIYHPKKIAVPVNAPARIDQMAKAYGTELLKIRADHRSMIEASLNEKAEFVGGTRGGFIFSDFHFASDGMFAMAKIMELMALNKIRLGKLAKTIPVPIMGRKDVPCPWERKGGVMRELIEYSKNQPRELIDGVKIFYNDAWVLVIPDQETPQFHITAEAKSRGRVDKLLSEFEAKILQWQN